MLTNQTPKTWQDLQAEVARILTDCGMETEVEKTVQTVRGAVEIDVLATENVEGRPYLIICECKHWRSAVPQQTIHSFRTVAGDLGANIGYIVTMRGFQAGAFRAAENTNVRLVTWQEFQTIFEPLWMKVYFMPTITKDLEELTDLTEPFVIPWFHELSEGGQEAYLELRKPHIWFGSMAMQLSTYSQVHRKQSKWPELPLRIHQPELVRFSNAPAALLDATGYRDLLNAMLDFGGSIVSKFHDLRKEHGRTA